MHHGRSRHHWTSAARPCMLGTAMVNKLLCPALAAIFIATSAAPALASPYARSTQNLAHRHGPSDLAMRTADAAPAPAAPGAEDPYEATPEEGSI